MLLSLPKVPPFAWRRVGLRRLGLFRLGLGLPALGLALTAWAGGVAAANYEFLAAPEIDLNRVYRLDKATGEVSACQYGLKEGTVGVTLCYPPGEGAHAQGSSEYALVASGMSGKAAFSGSICAPA